MFLPASSIIALAGSAAGIVPASIEITEPNPKVMSQAEIRTFNAALDKGHKYYIRCKRGAPTGSFVRNEFSCRTNEKWRKAEDSGNDEARDIMEEMKSKSWNTNSPGGG